jgi:predicted unusual protein kinase regulating ubiquinone biosynthesis (AarF/ABC1/UbiB family)
MLLRHSIFHADPHPGNISVDNDGTLILYDYGMVGSLDNETRIRFQFVKVLKKLLEEKELLKEAHIEEIKVSFKRVKGVAPLLKTYLETQQHYQKTQQRSYNFLGGIKEE